ncbi:MAG: hypothetical protein QOD71_2103 [Thermoleophilaceae bacterium]|jgi:hypothetical protein|nr:hypothetical protein [Thermoleophilaceae bacterium]
MRLLRLPYAFVRIPAELALELAKRSVSVAYGFVRSDDEQGVTLREPPRPEYFRPPPPPPPPPSPPRRPRPPRSNGHVSEEAVLVAEVAEQGAEDGAGAEIRVEAPWPGYDRMTAAEIIGRLRGETPEVGAAVSLYEASHKARRSVLEAAARSMR